MWESQALRMIGRDPARDRADRIGAIGIPPPAALPHRCWRVMSAAVKVILTTFCAFAAMLAVAAAADPKPMPEKTSPTAAGGTQKLTFGGGCFWCMEAVFQRLDGVKKVVSGYAGGSVPNPTYEAVCTGETGHAEVVQITFDPAVITLDHLLEIFWASHDPTTVLAEDTFSHGKLYKKGTAYQGNDIGSQYRSILLHEDDAQKEAFEKSKAAAKGDFKQPIATEIEPLKEFYVAEAHHQNYYNLNKDQNPYCSVVITPKLKKLIEKGKIKSEP
jgi:peptide-methionine (S)-S-oxide reductase